MSDLPTRLRECYCPEDADEAACREAAAEIERLQQKLDTVTCPVPNLEEWGKMQAEIERLRVERGRQKMGP